MRHAEPETPSPEARPGRRVLAVTAALLVLVVVAGGALVGYVRWCEGSSGERSPLAFAVPEGASGTDVLGELRERGVVRCGGLVGRYLLQRSGLAKEIRAGTYDLTTNMTFEEALVVLTSPPPAVPTVRLTIPEGFRLSQIAERAARDLGISARRLLRLAESGRFSLPPYLPQGTPTAEGFLFPETYRFIEGKVSPRKVIERLLAQFREEAARLPWENGGDLGVTAYEAVIVASMIEEEARLADERPKIAAVIYNRLQRGMVLGIDATLQYVDPDPEDGLTKSDLAIDSPYNTRLHPGLPPTPISSPGRDSLRAALEPADVPFLYYVLCGEDGHHEFSVSYEQFLEDKARCLG